MNYTRGPLTVHHNGYEIDIEERIKAGTEVLATIHNLGRSREAEQHANAHLYAAAPLLLEALQLAHTYLANNECAMQDSGNWGDAEQDLLETLQAAIAAAEGRKD